MARARLLKPDFFEDEKLTAMPFGARLLFQAYWCLADREGRLEDRPSRIAAFAFPPMGNEKLQATARRDVTAWRNLLLDSGMVQRYEVEGEPYLLLVHFKDHQRPHQNEPRSNLPAPPLAPMVTNGYQSTPMVPPENTSHASGAGSNSGSGNDSSSRSGRPDPVLLVESKNIFRETERCLGRSLTASECDKLREMETTFPEETWRYALREASDLDKRNLRYIERVCERKERGEPDERKPMGRNPAPAQEVGDIAAVYARAGIRTEDLPIRVTLGRAEASGVATLDGRDDP